jgi:hypothetical protein
MTTACSELLRCFLVLNPVIMTEFFIFEIISFLLNGLSNNLLLHGDVFTYLESN